jgi:hypothetical protein
MAARLFRVTGAAAKTLNKAAKVSDCRFLISAEQFVKNYLVTRNAIYFSIESESVLFGDFPDVPTCFPVVKDKIFFNFLSFSHSTSNYFYGS